MAGRRAAKQAAKTANCATARTALTVYRNDLHEALGRSGRTLRAMHRALNDHGSGTLAGDDERIKVWSDLHLGHANIIRYCERPFQDVGEMDATLWANWSATVGPADTLVCVGDVAMGAAVGDATWERVRAAPGRSKVLAVGNHDLNADGTLRVRGFDRTPALLVSDGEPPLVWTHAPLPRVPSGCVNVHGHTHTRNRMGSPHINVSVEQLEYRPIALARLRLLARRLLAGDHPPGGTTIEQVRRLEQAVSRP